MKKEKKVHEDNKKEKQDKKNKLIYVFMILLIILCIILIICLVRKNEETLTPDYAPGTIDTNAIKEKDDGKKLEVSNGGGAVSISYSNIVEVDSKNKTIKMYFKNPSASRESIVLDVIVLNGEKEYSIAKSDLLPPGYALYKLDLNKKVNLPKGGYKGIFRTTYYDETSGEREIVNSEIEISIEVK